MSAYAPPSQFQEGPTHRQAPNWQSAQSRHAHHADSSAHGNGGLGEKFNEYFGSDSRNALPMYKDKPRGAYPGSRRRRWYQQKRIISPVLITFALICWWFGFLSPLSYSITSKTQTEKTGGKSPSWFGTGETISWADRAEKVKETFKISFKDYKDHAWGYDEYHPVSKGKRQMTPKGMGWIIVDALDTMMLMNLTDELTDSRKWIHESLDYDQDHDVNTFETTIRMLGGLLSAHYLSTQFGGAYAPVKDGLSDDMYIEKAADLADRLLGAYGTQSGVPLASVNLHTMKGIPSHDDGGASSTAEATSLQLEMKYLAKLTGEEHYWEHAEKVMQVVDHANPPDGLVPIFIYADRGIFRGDNIRLGSRGDSYYEYLIKQYLQTSEMEPIYQQMWNESIAGIKKHLLTYSHPSNFTVLAERPNGLNRDISPKMDHLVCFIPGTIALATTGGMTVQEAKQQAHWGPQQDEDMLLAEELIKTCWGMYKVTPTGLAGEITHFNIHSPPLMYESFPQDAKPTSPATFDAPTSSQVGHDDYNIKFNDAHNLQRPETVESLFYMWRITGEEKYRQWGWEMFEAFTKWTDVGDGSGYSSLNNVLKNPPGSRDNMESFWLAETLKYFYLLFSPDEILPLTDVVFNTEAHPFPRFQLGKLFKTGWERKARGQSAQAPQETQIGAFETQPRAAVEEIATPVKTAEQAVETVAQGIVEAAAVPVRAAGGAALDPVTGQQQVQA